MSNALTAPAIEKLKPDPTKRIEVSDGLLPALRVVITPNGSKSFAVRFKVAGVSKKLTLGSVDKLRLSDARDAAREALRSVAKGEDPTQLKKIAKAELAAKARAHEDFVENILEEFFRRHVSNLKSAPHVERLLRLELKPWYGRRIQEIGKTDVLRLIEKVHDRGSPTTARRLLANLKTFFTWLIGRDVVTTSPCAGMKAQSEEVHRDRVLTDEELRVVYRTAASMPYPFGPMVQLLALTGQRREEVAGMRWSELDLCKRPVWSLPSNRTKNARAHDIPLSAQCIEILASLPRIGDSSGETDFVFTTTGETRVSGFSRGKMNLDKAISKALKTDADARGAKPKELPTWRWHDLRRTFASGCAKLGVSLPVVEKCLNHVSGSFGGIVGVYQRHDFADEKRKAFEAWGEHVASLMERSNG